MNTGACESAITFIDGEKGILRYRGYPIEELAEQRDFVETSYLLIYGQLPTQAERETFEDRLTRHSLIHEDMQHFFAGFPPTRHPMAMLSAMVDLAVGLLPGLHRAQRALDLHITRLLSKVRTIAAFAYKKCIGQPFMYPRNELAYCANFLHMMFAVPTEEYEVSPVLEQALNLLLILHADHEQNCSTSTVRMVGSSRRNLYASIAAGICALWGPLHGGANQAVIEMLEEHPATTAATTRSSSTTSKNKSDGLPPHGLRPPRLQELRPAREDPQEDVRRGPRRTSASRIRCSTSPSRWRRSRSRTTTSSRRSSTRTSTSTAASSTARWASRRTCSR